MKTYEVTFVWPNDDWTWVYVESEDFHAAMLQAMLVCPRPCRVKSILPTGKVTL